MGKRITDVDWGGGHISGDCDLIPQRQPEPRQVRQELADRVREITDNCSSGKDVKQIIAELNPAHSVASKPRFALLPFFAADFLVRGIA